VSREASEHALIASAAAEQGHVVLIGSNHQENLALQYLAAALEGAGFSVDLLGFNDRSDAPFVLERIRLQPPLLVGIQIAFQYTVDDCLWLARALRDDGYRGHITSGGHVATFCYAELLSDGSPLDSVVRHEGEVTLLEIVTRLSEQRDLVGVQGSVHRGTGQLCCEPTRLLPRKLDELPLPRRPKQPYRVAGVPIAFALTSRGCHGDCNYCCINAFTRSAGGPAYRLRSPAAVAEELGMLARRGVRVVFVQDDLFILPSERAALARIEALSDALMASGVPALAFWIKGRPESITAPVLEAAKRLGAIHLFLGIENASAERLAYLGRTHQPADAERALALCEAAGVHPSFNVMLFDPDSTLADVEQNLDFLERHVDLPWNVCRTEIYPGTHLFERLAGAGRLMGDFRSWGYRMMDPQAELLFRILRVSLHERALATTSLHNRLISLAFAWQLHARLFPGPETSEIVAQARELGREVRADTVAILRRALAWVIEHRAEMSDGKGAASVTGVSAYAVAEGRAAGLRDFPRHQRAERLWDLLHARGQMLTAERAEAPIRFTAAGTAS
jgi:radical SAM superfamily enzyme YgiQ (UPF0313 family)